MSTTSKPAQTEMVPSPVAARVAERPTLESGDHLTRAEFERRYHQRPDIKKAELIEGVVYMPSPVRFKPHAGPHMDLVCWLGNYRAATPGVEGADNATVRLDLDNEPQPDVLLRIAPDHGGQSQTSDDGYIEAAPELIAEITASSKSYDLHSKMNAYRRNGVQEYLVVLTEERDIRWFVLREGRYVQLAADESGLLRSEVFPGLWLDKTALLSGDLAKVLKSVEMGLQSPEHLAFVEQLAQAPKIK